MVIFARHWPLIATIVILYVAVTLCLILSVSQNDGHIVYALDDTYIHMAMARNFSQHGVWGITKYGFSSSSSSLLWTLLLSFLYFLWGVNEAAPITLNIVWGTLITTWLYFVMRKNNIHSLSAFSLLLLMIFVTPLPALILSGQEHTMHAFLSILFVYLSSEILSTERSSSGKHLLLFILSPLIIMARYEGLFLVLAVACLFVVNRKPLYALFLGVLGVGPVIIYGLFSIWRGWYFLPNSVLLKGNIPDLSSLTGISRSLGYTGYQQIMENPHMLMLILGALILFQIQYSRHKTIWQNSVIRYVIFIVTTCLHMQFAETGFFYRYEAYLVCLGVFVIGISLPDWWPKEFRIERGERPIAHYFPLALISCFVLIPFLLRGTVSLIRIPQATTNIYEQQYQMGLFLKEFYEGETVAANDIGAINYLADIKCLDLIGLGSLDVARAKRTGNYSTERIYRLAKARRTKIAIVYKDAFGLYGGLPPPWIEIGHWEILNNVVCGSRIVTFYAVDPAEKNTLVANLRQFSSRLPTGIIQSGLYIRTSVLR